jgi:predicted ABC-type ATPase
MNHMQPIKKIIIIAGPNGAGKTTFARNFLPREADTLHFINADLIAAGLAPFNPESVSFKAARLMLDELDQSSEASESFAFETTLSGKHYLQRIQNWQDQGYIVKLWFITLSTPELAVSRVSERVSQGGHHIPEDVIRRRFAAGLKNLRKYQEAVNSWAVYDGAHNPPKLMDWSKHEH